MFVNLNELNIKREINFSYEVCKDNDLDKRIKDLNNSVVTGKVYKNGVDEVILDCSFKGTMIIEDSITLEEIPYNFDINISENISNLEENYDNVIKKSENILDLKQILWQNIVLEVPISYSLRENTNLKGDGWELVDGKKKSEEIDPRLKKLEDLLKGDD